MLLSTMDSWLAIVKAVSRELEWDASLVFTFMVDDHTLVFQVRRSPLSFTVRQQPSNAHHFNVSYTVFPPGSAWDSTMRRLGTTQAHSAASVGSELEKWLRDSVARYAGETTLPD